jgi:hypothetical protein
MSDAAVLVSVTPEEWEIVCRLRDVSPGRSRQGLLVLMRELMAFTAEPRCSQMQADGVPCASVHASCEDCQRVWACLGQLRQMVGAPEAGDLA